MQSALAAGAGADDQETLINRFDVELAAGPRGSADLMFVAGGVDDHLHMSMDRKLPLHPFEGLVGMIEFIASAIDGAWLVSLNENK